MVKRIMVTGATGFVGRGLVSLLNRTHGFSVLAAVRTLTDSFPASVAQVCVPDLKKSTNWVEALADAEVVVHSAARVHVMDDSSADPLSEYRRVNVDGTLNLARQAAAAGVKRFVFISSIKVNGESTKEGEPFTADGPVNPLDPYGVSKREAELGLLSLAESADMDVVIIRPTLVYGPGVKANFLTMMRWLQKGIPLPFGSIDNRRSLVALDNLVDLIITCIKHPAAANQVFLVSDGEDLSTSGLLRRLSVVLGKPARLLPIPSSLLRFCALVLGQKSLSQRLCDSLQVDISKTRKLLSWTPPVSVDEAMTRAAKPLLENKL